MLQRHFVYFVALVALAACGGGGGGGTSPGLPAPSPTPVPITFNDYKTFGYDNQRDVFNPNSTAFTPATLTQLHLAWQTGIGNGSDYNTQTQAVIATEIPGHAGMIFVGGGGLGNVYGYDALTGKLIWTRPLGVERYTCTGATPYNFGVGGTVAYDPVSRSLYVIGNANAQADAPAVNTLYHIDAASGTILGAVNFAPTNLGPTELNFSHTAVMLANGVAYVGTAATCDISSWRGRIVAVNVPAMTIAQTFFTLWNATTQPWGGGGIWGWGGVSLDFSGNVLTGVGNADNGVTTHGSIKAPFEPAPQENSGIGESFIELTPNLTLLASQHPIPAGIYNSTPDALDLDVNGTSVVFKPAGAGCDTLAALQSKSGSLYVYDTTKIASGPVAQYQLAPPSYGDAFIGSPAYSPATGLLYEAVPIGAGSLYPPGMIAINPGCGVPAVTWHTAFGPDSDLNGDSLARSVPAVSAGGVVFVGTPCQVTAAGTCAGSVTAASVRSARPRSLRKPALCCAPPGNTVGGAVWALDASTGLLLNGGNPILTTPAVIRMPPTIDGKWLFVVDNGGDMYGLTVDGTVPAVAAKYRTVDARSRLPWEERPVSTHP